MERPYRRTGAYLDCPICGATFYKKRAELRPVNYCSYACAAKGTANLRPPAKGARRSVASEFKNGQQAHNHLPVGTERLRVRARRSERRWFVKIAEPNVWKLRAVHVWEQANGPLARGHVVHHRNRDSTDDRLENLESLTRTEHIRTHRQDLRS